MSKSVWKFRWDCGRSGELVGLFVASPESVAKLVGRHISFGEVLGKHSDIQGTVESKDIKEISSDPAFVSQFEELIGSIGHNPFEYLEEEGY